MRNIRHAIEAAAAWLIYSMFTLLPVDTASAVGGWIGRIFGPRLNVSNNARNNLAKVFPNLKSSEIEKIVVDMWENLGRTAGEHPHISQFDPYTSNSRVEVIGTEHCDLLSEKNKCGLFFSGHIANWEIGPLACTRRGLTTHIVYRRSNNPFFNKLVQKSRNALGAEQHPKGSDGAKGMIRALNRGDKIAMLVDQKMNDGISVPFLGREAMTAPALAELALRYNCPVIPARVERLKHAKFRVTFYPPLEFTSSGDKKSDVFAIMEQINCLLGAWITERPEQWLWLHNRWPI